MQDWYNAQFFSSDLLVKREKWDDNYRRLDALVKTLGTEAPFLHNAVVKKELTESDRQNPWQSKKEQRSQQVHDPFHPPHHQPVNSLSQSAGQFTTKFDPFASSRSQASVDPDRAVIPTSISFPQSLAAVASQNPWNRIAPAPTPFDDHLVSNASVSTEYPSYSATDLSISHQRTHTGNLSSLTVSSPSPSEKSGFTPLSVARTPINAWQQNVVNAQSSAGAMQVHQQPKVLADLLSSPPLSAQLDGTNLDYKVDPLPSEPAQDLFPQNFPAVAQPSNSTAVDQIEPQMSLPTQLQDKELQSARKTISPKKSPSSRSNPASLPTSEAPAKSAKAKKTSTASVDKAPVETQPLPPQVTESKETKAKPLSAPWSAKETSEPTTGTGPSLREIQAKEAKAEELRKAATKKVKAAAVAAEQARLSALEDISASLPSASSWAQANNAPWANASSAKKTLKEIQEEEARQQDKRLIAQRTTGTPIASKGYAGSVNPNRVVSPSANAGGSWSVIGKEGKATPLEVAAPSPSVVRSASTQSVKLAPASVTIRLPAVNGKTKATVVAASAPELDSPAPSAELLKWMRSALTGLTVPSMPVTSGFLVLKRLTVEDFINMLLQFPVNADPSTMEIISDAVYANSRTLDGRRFAESFVLKRKADIAIGPSLAAATSAPKSAADILKMQPKKQEVLNFKIVGTNKQSKKKK